MTTDGPLSISHHCTAPSHPRGQVTRALTVHVLLMCSFPAQMTLPPSHKESPELEVNTGALCLAWVLTRTKPPDSDHRWRHGSMSGHPVMDDLLPLPTQPGLLYRPHANTGNKLFRSGFSSLFIFLNDRELVTALRILFIS